MEDETTNKWRDKFTIIWLDNTIEKTRDNLDTKAIIRRLARGHLLTFDDRYECLDYVIRSSLKDRIFFIVSNTFGKSVTPFINEMPHVQPIYVYCGSQNIAEAWIRPNFRIAGIFTVKETLINKLCHDLNLSDNDNELPMSVFHLEEGQSSLQNLSKESAKFMWYRIVLIALRLTAKHCDSKTEMLAECRAHYHDDEIEQKKIKNFDENYSPTKALWWYSYDSFVYRLLNKALRTQNIEIIFKFRFFINDLHNQIERLYHQYLHGHSDIRDHNLTVYRGQRLTMEEVNLLERNVNQFISMNSFLSATLIKELAEIFADTSDQVNETSPLQSVLFIIHIFDMTVDMTPFAFIRNYSCCQDEEEVLFSISAVFKVQSVEHDGTMWHVHLQLSQEENEISQNLANHMMKQIGSEPDPLALGWFLYRMSEFDKAERYAKLMLKQLPVDDKSIGNAYNLLGLIYKDTNHLLKSIEYYEKALKSFSSSTEYEISFQAIATHCNLGLAYLAIGDDTNADKHRREAEMKYLTSPQVTCTLLRTTIESLKGKIQAIRGDHDNSLITLVRVLQQKTNTLPSGHPSISTTLNEIGVVYSKMGDDERAFDYFQKALQIGNESLPPTHLDLAEYHTNIGHIYYKQEKFNLALEQFESALRIILDYPRIGGNIVSELEEYVTETKNKLRQCW